MPILRAAIYARVSSEQQTGSGAIASQIAALDARVVQDGHGVSPEHRFVDDGYSSASLLRPALERLRDAAAAGDFDRLYVHSPDRLARRYAYQVLLADELRRAGVEVVFLNRPLGQSPEDDLLLQVQGMIADYERAKILERSRRGKRHAAHAVSVNVPGGAPYGYRYIDRHAGAGIARYELAEEPAAVCVRSSTGSASSGSALAKSASGCGTPTTPWPPTSRCGTARRSGHCSRTRPTSAPPLWARRAHSPPPRLRPVRGGTEQPRTGRGGRHAARGVDHDSRSAPHRPGALRAPCRRNWTRRQRNRQGGSWRALSASGAHGVPAVRVCILRQGGQPGGRQGETAGLRVLSLLRQRAYRFGGEPVCHNPQVRTDRL